MANSTDEMRRWLGAFCLAVAAGLLVWGQTVLKPHLAGGWFVLYWALCFALTLAAICFALLDLRAIRRRARKEHRSLMERTLKEVDTEFAAKPNPTEDTGSEPPK